MLGKAFCYLSAHAVYIPGAANIAFIFSISLFRLLSCQYPLRFRDSVSIGQANVFSVVVWVWSFVPVIVYLIHRPTVQFQLLSSDCGLIFEKKNLVNAIVAGPYVIIPFIGLIVCNIMLFYIASKSAARIGRSVRQASITIGAVSGLFVISWLPYIIRQLLMIKTNSELNWPFRPDILFYELSIFGNPIIYTIVNKRFKNFLKCKILSVLMPSAHLDRMSRFYTNSAPSLTEVAGRKERKNKVHVLTIRENKVHVMHHAHCSNNLANDVTPTDTLNGASLVLGPESGDLSQN